MFRRLATIAIAVAACAAELASLGYKDKVLGAAGDAAAHSQHVAGVFVSLGKDTAGLLLTVEQNSSLRSLRVAPSATVSEIDSGGPAQPASLTSLKAGEPVDLQLGPDGAVASVVARYASVATRVTVAQDGYVVAANGNVYTLVGAALAAAPSLGVGTYVLMRTDPATGDAFDLAASQASFRTTAAQGSVVAVTFVVRVPANTPPTDAIYVATNAGNWTPNGTRLVPLTGGRWTATLQLAAGTQIEYRYTRGSWATDERTAAGTPTANRTLSAAKTAGAQTVDDVVARWADLPS
ncbi:MAG TPA: CBM20 domain-containing protein [Candidatus Eremiobacteraceae bacterium]|nr:CBM20 domain-containing protein [Candidatus Eremiobacteraceae bacterium]